MKYQPISLSASNGAIYYVPIATMIFSREKISCFSAKAHLVCHWCLYNKERNFVHVILIQYCFRNSNSGSQLTSLSSLPSFKTPYRGVFTVPLQLWFIHKHVVIATISFDAIVRGYKWAFKLSTLFSFERFLVALGI